MTWVMPLKGSPQSTRNLTGPRGPRLIVDAKVGDGDRNNVGLRRNDVLRVNRPDAGVREVEGTLDLALIDPLEVAHNVRVTGTDGRHGEHSHESGAVTWQNVDNDVERTV